MPARDLFLDCCALAGLVLVVAGAGWIYRPAAPLVLGGVLLAVAVWGHHRR